MESDSEVSVCSGIATPGSDSTQELNDFDSQGSVKDGSLEDSLEMTSQTLDVSDTPSEKVDVLASVSQGIGTILEALECPTLASEPTAYQNTPGEPTPYAADGRAVDTALAQDYKDTCPITQSSTPSLLSLMCMMSKQIALQRDAIARLESPTKIQELATCSLRKLTATVGRLGEQAISQAATITQIKEDKSAQDIKIQRINSVASEQSIAMQDLKNFTAEQGLKINMLQATIDSQARQIQDHETSEAEVRSVLETDKARNASLASTVAHLEKENELLRSSNSTLDGRIETLSDMQKLHHTATTAQQGHLDSFHGFVRSKLNDVESTLSSLSSRTDGAEPHIRYLASCIDEAKSRSKRMESSLDAQSKAVDRHIEYQNGVNDVMSNRAAKLEEDLSTRFHDLLDNRQTGHTQIDETRERMECIEQTIGTLTHIVHQDPSTKAAFLELKDDHQCSVAAAEKRFNKIESDLNEFSKHTDGSIADIRGNVNELHGDVGVESANVRRLQAKDATYQNTIAQLERSIMKLTTASSDMKAELKKTNSETKGLDDRFASVQDLEKVQQCLRENIHDHSESLKALEKDVADISTVVIPKIEQDVASKLDTGTFKIEANRTTKRFNDVVKNLDIIHQSLAETSISIESHKRAQSQKNKDSDDLVAKNYEALINKIDSEITKVCYQNSLEPAQQDEFELKVTHSSGGDKEKMEEGEGLADPYGNDSTTKNEHQLEHHYYTSFEEDDRRCTKCGEEHDEVYFVICKNCRQKRQDMMDAMRRSKLPDATASRPMVGNGAWQGPTDIIEVLNRTPGFATIRQTRNAGDNEVADGQPLITY